MPKYIKSHSNYVLKSKHQVLGDGSTIFERDITTIGGLNQFAQGQKPIYRSNNFIITVRDDGGISNQYNRKKWTENKSSGDVWTATAVSGMVSQDDTQNDTKIVLKQDYYDFRDFCYYGSLSEMFRASITDAISRFPGELYGTDYDVYYTTYETIDGEQIETRRKLGSEIPSRDDEGRITGYTTHETDLHLLMNPFGINMYATKLPKDVNPLKYFAEGGYKNYVYVDENGEEYQINDMKIYNFYSEYDSKSKKYIPYSAITEINESEVTTTISSGTPIVTYYPCKGERIGALDLNHVGTPSIKYDIGVFLGDDDIPYYLYEKESGTTGLNELHIRPTKKYLDEFYNECDNFQRLILNPKSTPKYKATFSVIKENENGYYREFEDFIFPTSEGGYNIDATSYGFNTYTTRLSQIGEFYDEFFTDNLYRSMTHEAIKNFDWTYTREFVEGDEEEYVLGGEKVQKALRVFAREFDEILSYINNIKNLNRVTYDERGNLPDYFLTDTVENEGWNVALVTPFDLSGSSTFNDSDCDTIETHFIEASGDVTPYTEDLLEDQYGYFISCCSSGETPCEYSNGQYKKISASANQYTMFDECAKSPILRNRIRSYSDERVYSYHDVNNEFLRRLKLNSRAIWRHKGTIEGIDMILGMFGLRNKKWVERKKEGDNTCYNKNYDYEITEYIAETNPIEDCWDAPHQMYHIDWVNSTKTITYDYRSISNYNRDGSDIDYIPYQGLPVKYVDVGYFKYGNEKYFIDFFKREIQRKNNDKYVKETDIREDNTFVLKRKTFEIDKIKNIVSSNSEIYDIIYGERRDLFPNFEKYEKYDGDFYFQMNGGWEDKKFYYSGGTDLDGYYGFQFDADNNIVYAKEGDLFKETVRNIRRFDTLQDMLSVPSYEIHDDQIVYVTNIQDNIAVLAGKVYNIKSDRFGKYIELIKANGVVQAGDDFFFDSVIRVYDRYGTVKSINISEIPNGQPINCYIVNGRIQCYDDTKNCSDQFVVIDPNAENYTNYFKINDFSYSNRLGGNGWKRLSLGDREYKMVSTIINDNKGNNPHNGMMRYDNGEEYFEYYKHLFKYALENDLFDERCYSNFDAYRDTINGYGFSPISSYITSDKIDDYTDVITFKHELCGNGSCVEVPPFSSTTDAKCAYKSLSINEQSAYTINNSAHTKTSRKNIISNGNMNTKVIRITFKLHEDLIDNAKHLRKEVASEMKYIDDIVMNYLTQMIPSTAILQIRYE